MLSTIGYAAASATSPLKPFRFTRREIRQDDVLIEILFCGICHTDLHIARNEWNGTRYPVVPGHEILGRVLKVGRNVTRFKEDDLVGVGCISNSCRQCSCCVTHLEQYCEKGYILVFNRMDPEFEEETYGGFSKHLVIKESYVLRIPKEFKTQDLPAVAPLLCAGITTYSPLNHWKISKGMHVGIVGLGGLGHLAIKLSSAMGAHVTVFTTSPKKMEEAKQLGADEVVLSTNKESMSLYENRCDFILNTVAHTHDLNSYLALLKRDATMCLVGLPSEPYPLLRADLLIRQRRNLAGSLIGSIQETQEVLDFCAKHHILANIELISISQVNEAFERMLKNDVRYRFVIDLSSLKE
jgi:uncharacterized zinc-type alcohol dehydrogenase-like protein